MLTQWNQQLSKYMFSKAIECLEQKNSKTSRLQRPLDTKKMSKVQNISFEIWKYKAVRKYKINQVKLVLPVWFSLLYEVSNKLY